MDDPLWNGLCIFLGGVALGSFLWVTVEELRDIYWHKKLMAKFNRFAEERPLDSRK